MANLDQKILEETEELKEKMATMQQELAKFATMDSLKGEANQLKQALLFPHSLMTFPKAISIGKAIPW
jgi:cell shape-determining protein MreC